MVKDSKDVSKRFSAFSRALISKPIFLVVLAIAIIGSVFFIRSDAAPGGKGGGKPSPVTNTSVNLYLAPQTTRVSAGDIATVAVRMNTQDRTTNAFQADFSYPASKLEFVAIDANGSPFELTAQKTGGNGEVKIAAASTTPRSGDQLIANVTFKVIGSKGSAALSFLPSSGIAASDGSGNILAQTFGTTLNIRR